jgi:hypothetical protein
MEKFLVGESERFKMLSDKVPASNKWTKNLQTEIAQQMMLL